ncbi:MAG: phosphoribosyltransferase [Candidatus Thorarchaeota archaeon]
MDQADISSNAVLQRISNGTDDQPRLFRVKSDYLLDSTYILESPAALNILLKPWLVGAELANEARQSTVDFLKAAYQIVPELRSARFSEIAEVVPLAGALYYSTAEAFEIVFGETINRCFIGAKRYPSPLGWVTELSYMNFEALPKNPLIIVGDTIATGGTIQGILEAVLEQEVSIQAIVIYSIAGGLSGAVRLRKFTERIGVPVYAFFSNAIFGVESNGTDMPWLHEGTIVSPELRDKAMSTYGPDLGERWCSVWDWGDRAKHPLKHLNELLERCETELSQGPDVLTGRILNTIREETVKSIDRWNESPRL